MQNESIGERQLVISREFKAPRQLVWRAFTEPEHLIKWWGPNGFTNTFHEIDMREGGVWRFIMHGPDGTDYNNRVTFTEITPMDRIAYDQDSDMDNDPNGFQSVISFSDAPLGTKVTLQVTLKTKEARDRAAVYAIEGGQQTLGRLAAHLETMQ
jgi:uncharacterized protein YndB with AHSA1/START domain